MHSDSVNRPRRLTLAATVLGSSLAFLEATALTIALPSIREDLSLSLAGAQWIVLGYTLALVSLLLIAGAVGDRYGHARVFAGGALLFAGASLLAGLAPTGDWLVALRLAQGAAAAIVVTTSLALLRVAYGDDAGRAIGLWVAGTSIATMAGPLAGGLATDLVSWRLIFLVNVPLGLAAAGLVRAGACSGKVTGTAQQGRRPLDVTGAALAAAALATMTYAVVSVQEGRGAAMWGAGSAAIVLGALFVAWERRAAEPMLPLGLFRRRVFALVNMQTLLVYAGVYALLFYLPLFMQSSAVGASATVSGLVLMVMPLLLVLASPWSGRLADRHGPRLPLAAGAAVMAGAMLLLAVLDPQDVAYGIVPAVVVFAAGLALLVAPITATAVRAAPPAQSGIASGVNNAVSRLGGLLAIGLVGIVVTSAFASYPTGSGNGASDPFPAGSQPAAVDAATVHAFRRGCTAIAAMLAAGALVGAALGPARPTAGAGPSDASR